MEALLWLVTPAPIPPLWLATAFMFGLAVAGWYYVWRLRRFAAEMRAEHEKSLNAIMAEFERNLDHVREEMVLVYGTPIDYARAAPD